MDGSVICAWCGRVLFAGDQAKPVSHGICPDCAKRVDQEVA